VPLFTDPGPNWKGCVYARYKDDGDPSTNADVVENFLDTSAGQWVAWEPVGDGDLRVDIHSMDGSCAVNWDGFAEVGDDGIQLTVENPRCDVLAACFQCGYDFSFTLEGVATDAPLPLVLWRYGPRALVPARFRLQLFRGTLLVADSFLFFGALALIPLADTLALTFVAPLMLTALSALVLGERVGVRRWSAVAIGFAGTLIIVRPGFAAFEPGAVLALGAGVAYAIYQLLTRKLAGSAPPLVTLGYTALVGTLVMTAALPAYWVTPSPTDLALMVGMGATAAVAHFLIISAFERAQASLLAPFNYCEMIGAVAIGYLVFGDFPDSWTWLGVLVLIGSGVYISLRERRVRARARGPAMRP